MGMAIFDVFLHHAIRHPQSTHHQSSKTTFFILAGANPFATFQPLNQ
jgi:hypothetical protein